MCAVLEVQTSPELSAAERLSRLRASPDHAVEETLGPLFWLLRFEAEWQADCVTDDPGDPLQGCRGAARQVVKALRRPFERADDRGILLDELPTPLMPLEAMRVVGALGRSEDLPVELRELRALLAEATARFDAVTGEAEVARGRAHQAATDWATLDVPAGVARAVALEATIALRQGDLDGARQLYRQLDPRNPIADELAAWTRLLDPEVELTLELARSTVEGSRLAEHRGRGWSEVRQLVLSTLTKQAFSPTRYPNLEPVDLIALGPRCDGQLRRHSLEAYRREHRGWPSPHLGPRTALAQLDSRALVLEALREPARAQQARVIARRWREALLDERASPFWQILFAYL